MPVGAHRVQPRQLADDLPGRHRHADGLPAGTDGLPGGADRMRYGRSRDEVHADDDLPRGNDLLPGYPVPVSVASDEMPVGCDSLRQRQRGRHAVHQQPDLLRHGRHAMPDDPHGVRRKRRWHHLPRWQRHADRLPAEAHGVPEGAHQVPADGYRVLHGIHGLSAGYHLPDERHRLPARSYPLLAGHYVVLGFHRCKHHGREFLRRVCERDDLLRRHDGVQRVADGLPVHGHIVPGRAHALRAHRCDHHLPGRDGYADGLPGEGHAVPA